MKFIAIYVLLGLVATSACWLLLKRRDRMMAEDVWSIYSIGGILLFLLWPIFVPVMYFLAVRFPSPPSSQQDTFTLSDSMVGTEGVATSALLPAGRVDIGDESFDALSVCGPIDKGMKVAVVERDTLLVKVTKA